MTELGVWLRDQLKRRGLTQSEVAVYAGVGQATISDVINKGHVPKVETLFRLADFFEAPREHVLRAAGHLPPARPAGMEEADFVRIEEEYLVRDLLREFRRLPDEWKPVAVEQVSVFRRLSELGPVRFVGDESVTRGEEEFDAGQRSSDEAARAA